MKFWFWALAFSTLTSPVFGKDAEKGKKAQATPAATAGKPVVVEMETSLGSIEIELDAKAAPKSVANFLSYVNAKFYDSVAFHRVIDGFMIQGGGFELVGKDLVQKKAKDPIANEAKNGLKNVRGSIAMARTSDPNSATSQFFINVVDNPRLDHPQPDGHGYAVFGRVINGLDVVDKIKGVKTGMGKLTSLLPTGKKEEGTAPDVPVEPVFIKTARVKAEKKS